MAWKPDAAQRNFWKKKESDLRPGYAKVPLICQSCIYDLGIGHADVRPDLQMGYLACQDAYERDQRTAMGNVGAGTGATVGKAMGAERMMKSGLGSYAVQAGELKVGALVVVNALGDIYDSKTHEKIAGCGMQKRRIRRWRAGIAVRHCAAGRGQSLLPQTPPLESSSVMQI